MVIFHITFCFLFPCMYKQQHAKHRTTGQVVHAMRSDVVIAERRFQKTVY